MTSAVPPDSTAPLHARMSPRALRLLLLLATLLAFGLRLTALARQDIWWDEARNLDVALRPLAQIAVAPELDIQPPLYYYLLHGWLAPGSLQVGVSPALMAWWARFFSVIPGVLLPLLVAQLARRAVAPRRARAAAACAALIGALSPFWLAESQETRMYTWGLALLTAAALALLAAELPRASIGRRARVARLAAFVLFSSAALATHYNALFVLAAWYLWWGARCLMQPPRLRRLLAPLASGAMSLLLLSPLVPIALRQIPDYANPNLSVPSVAAYLISNAQGHWAGYAWDGAGLWGFAPWWLWSSLLLAAVGLGLGRRSAHRARETQALIFLLVWLAGGLSLYYIAVLDRGAFNVRYSAFVTPALVALAGAGLAGWGRLWPALLLFVSLGLAAFARADLYDARFDREDIAGVTTWLREKTRPGDVIFVDQKYPFGFYYTRFAADPAADPAGSEAAPARYLFVDVNTLDSQLAAWAADAQRIFWVQWFESDTDPRHAVPWFLSAEGRPAGESLFQGWRIEWWEMSPPSEFAGALALQPLVISAPPVESVEASLPATANAGAPLQVAIRWALAENFEVKPAAPRSLKARVALYNAHGDRLAQADERLLNDRHLAPAEWSADDRPLNFYLLTPDTLPSGEYEVRLLVYDAETLEPFTLLDDAGNPAGVEATLGSVTIE